MLERQQIVAVSWKDGKILIRYIWVDEIGEVVKKCMSRGWSYPRFYQKGYSTYEKLIEKNERHR